MIEIKTNIKGDIICKETEDSKGIGTMWIFTDLQNYVAETKLENGVLHHLCTLSVMQMERMTMISLKQSEIIRLSADLERMLKHLYLSSEERQIVVELEDNQFVFREDGNLLQKITLMRFEDDLKYEPDLKENSIQLINYSLGGLHLNNIEKNHIAEQMIKIYEKIQADRIAEALEKREKNKKEKKGLFWKK